MRFGLGFSKLRLSHSSKFKNAVLFLILLALAIDLAVVSVSLRYPYRLLAVADSTSLDTTSNGVCSRSDGNTTLVKYDIRQPIERPQFECVKTKTDPSVTVCLFDIWHDVFISRSLHSAGMWELFLVNEFTEAIRRGGHESGVLDIGANIGYYTLLAARLGHRVVAVEPALDSIKRLQHAAHLNHVTDWVTVVYNGIANVRMKATLRQSGHNQGDSRVELRVQECHGACPTIISTILLDDLVDIVPFSQAVMKMDIQGSEHYAFQCAGRLFDAVHFTHIFMEWEILREFYVDLNHTSRDKQLVEQMISFLFARNFRPYKLVYEGAAPLDPTQWGTWPYNIAWLRLPNTDEQLHLAVIHHKNWPL